MKSFNVLKLGLLTLSVITGLSYTAHACDTAEKTVYSCEQKATTNDDAQLAQAFDRIEICHSSEKGFKMETFFDGNLLESNAASKRGGHNQFTVTQGKLSYTLRVESNVSVLDEVIQHGSSIVNGNQEVRRVTYSCESK